MRRRKVPKRDKPDGPIVAIGWCLRGHHLAFAVADVAEALKLVETHGVRIAAPLQLRPDGFKQLFLYDPDGHLVELFSK